MQARQVHLIPKNSRDRPAATTSIIPTLFPNLKNGDGAFIKKLAYHLRHLISSHLTKAHQIENSHLLVDTFEDQEPR